MHVIAQARLSLNKPIQPGKQAINRYKGGFI